MAGWTPDSKHALTGSEVTCTLCVQHMSIWVCKQSLAKHASCLHTRTHENQLGPATGCKVTDAGIAALATLRTLTFLTCDSRVAKTKCIH